MTTLLTCTGPVPADSTGSRFGGVPLVPAGFRWPECATCAAPMQFVAQLRLEGARVAAVFLCDSYHGDCATWDPWEGANSVSVHASEGLVPAPVPGGDGTLLDGVAGLELADRPEDDCFEAAEAWSAATGRPELDVLGQWGGEPWWMQGDETPACRGCAGSMSFVAMLWEGHDPSGAVPNFGTGAGYVFVCDRCARGVFLFQC